MSKLRAVACAVLTAGTLLQPAGALAIPPPDCKPPYCNRCDLGLCVCFWVGHEPIGGGWVCAFG